MDHNAQPLWRSALGAAVSWRNLLLAGAHGAAACGIYLAFYYDAPRPWQLWDAAGAFVTTVGSLVLLLGLATGLAHLLRRRWRARFSSWDGSKAWLAVPALALVTALGGWLVEPVARAWVIVGCIALGGLLTTLALSQIRAARVGKADALGDAALGTWCALVIVELIFHGSTGGFFRWPAINGLLRVMSAEVVAFLFGPEALTVAGIAVTYLLGLALVAVMGRRVRWPDLERARFALAGVAIAGGVIAMSLAPGDARLRWIHHVHPTVSDLAHPASPDMVEPGEAPVVNLPSAQAYAAEPGRRSRAKNLVVIYIDTLSRGHLEVFGYDRPVAPNIARLARQSVRFTRARTNAGHTDLATVALFYGVHPYLNARKEDDYRRGHGGVPFHALLAQRGFPVAVLSGDWESQERGYAPLFPSICDRFLDARTAADQAEVSVWSGLREDIVVDEFLGWYPGQDRFVAYLKFIRPHQPYYTPDDGPRPFQPAAQRWSLADFHPTPDRAALVLNRYDNAVHWVDVQIGRVLDDLQRTGAWEDTAVILLADHGEAWGEHALYGHAMQQFEEFLSVPLLVRVPGVAPRDDGRMVSTVDVAPTVLDILGAPAHPSHEGGSLLDPAYAPEEFLAVSNITADLGTLQVGPWKYTEALLAGDRWLFHLERDPHERENLAWTPEHAARADQMRDRLRARLRLQLARAEALRTQETRSLLGQGGR